MEKFKLSLLLFSLYITSICYSQNIKLSGNTINIKDNQSIEFANVLVLQAIDSAYVNGTITAMDGNFEISLPKGDYIVHFRALGYESTFVNCTVDKDTNIGSIALKESSIVLSEIVVSASKPIIRREVDRMVFDASSVNTGGINALDVLQNMPGLNVTENSIRIIGKGEVIVLINDRQVRMSGKDLANLMKTYSASDLDKIEVITTPPAKYDAEGNAGVLNIVIKKARKDFFGGNLSYAHSFSNYNRGAVTGSLTYNKGKLSAYLNTSGGLGNTGYEESNNKFYPSSVWKSYTDIKQKNDYVNLRTGLDYEINKSTNIGFSAEYSLSKPNGLSVNETGIYTLNAQLPENVLKSSNTSESQWNVGIVNFHLDTQLDTLGKMMRFDVDYLTYKNSSEDVFRSDKYDADNQPIPSSQFGYNNEQKRDIQTFSTALGFVLPYNGYRFEFGLKTSFSQTQNGMNYYNHTVLGDQQNDFLYKENIYALYGDFTKQISKKWRMRGGLRAEYTQTKSSTEATNYSDKDTYWRVFPTIYIGYKPNDGNSLSLSLSNRISRPRFNMVNPFKLYENQYSIVYGKPDIKPLSYYSVNIGYTFKNNLNFSLYYNYIQDQFGQVIDMDETTNITQIYWDNYLRSHSVGLQNSYVFNKINWLQSYFQHTLSYSKSISDSPFTLSERSGINYYATLNNTFYFNKSKTFTGRLSGSYKSKEYTAGVIRNPYYAVSAGVNFSLLEGNLKLGLNYANFIVSKYSGVTNSNGMEMRFNNKFSYPSLQLSVSYAVGAKLSSDKRKNSIDDIKNRL